ncbi:hypothetical protein AVEN_37731-1 [Araneus ventricosus]|uniref:Uncharacterized protein n=1 Tax=Araneus ventricosus TaxID=182803 RepID=A0A4Y2BUM7_ARAVE|nr:hypothetical protein AVEN_37731-1 [Araneus ventricosus]
MFLFTSLLIPGRTLSYYRPLFPAPCIPLQVLFYYTPTTVDNLLVRNECQMVRVVAFSVCHPLYSGPLGTDGHFCGDARSLFTGGMSSKCHRNSDSVVMLSLNQGRFPLKSEASTFSGQI